jgi:hypothetical protein
MQGNFEGEDTEQTLEWELRHREYVYTSVPWLNSLHILHTATKSTSTKTHVTYMHTPRYIRPSFNDAERMWVSLKKGAEGA